MTEPTFEGLVRMFQEGQPSLGIFSDEGGQFLGGHAMSADNRTKTLSAFNKLWQGDAIKRTRAGDGSFSLHGRRLAVHLMVQPSVATKSFADPKASDTGFLPRFLTTEPPSTIGTRLSGRCRPPGNAISNFAARPGEILTSPMPMEQRTRELRPHALKLMPEARNLLERFVDRVEVEQSRGGPLRHVTGHAAKAAEQAARIAGVLTLWADLSAEAVEAATVANGIAIAEYCLSEAVRLADSATVSADIQRAERLRRWLIDDWSEPDILPSDVLQKAPIRTLRESPKARSALGHGWLVRHEPGTVIRGRARREAWRIVRQD